MGMARVAPLGAPLMVSDGSGSGGGARHLRRGADAYVRGQNAYAEKRATWAHGGPAGARDRTLRAWGAMGGGGRRGFSMGDCVKVQGGPAPGGRARPAGPCAPESVQNRQNGGFFEDSVFARAPMGGG